MLVYTEDALEEVRANQWLLPGVATAGAKNFASWKARRTPRPSGSELGCDIPVPMTLPSTFAAATTPSSAPVDVEEQDSATAVSSVGKRKARICGSTPYGTIETILLCTCWQRQGGMCL